MRRPIIILFSVIVLAILFVVLCTFVRHPYEKVLLNRFGHLVTEDNQTRIIPGYNCYLKYPSDGVIRIDTRLHLYYSPLQQINTSGSQSVSIRTYAAWRIVDPVVFQRSTRTDAQAQIYLENAILSAVGQTVSRRQIDEMFNVDPSKLKTEEMEAQIARDATNGNKEKNLTGMNELGIEIVQVGFSRMAFSPNNANAVYARMAEEQSAKATAFLQEGQAESSKIVAEGKRQATEITAEAHRSAEKIRGQADAEATAALATVQQSPAARDFYQFWKALEFVKTSFTKNTYLVLPSDSDWLRPLFSNPKNVQFVAPATQPAMKGGN